MIKIKAKLSVVACVVFALGLIACDTGNNTPKGVVNFLYRAVMSNNLNSFRINLTGNALREYGSPRGLRYFKNLLSNSGQNAELQFGSETLIRSEMTDPLNGTRIYSLEILETRIMGSPEPRPAILLNLEVTCEIRTVNNVPPTPEMITTTICKVSDLL